MIAKIQKFHPQTKKIILFLLACAIIGLSIATFFIDSEALLSRVGLNNAYIILFLVSATAGVSIFTASGFYAFFIAFLSLAVDPLIAGVIAGLGVTLGDIGIYALARLVAGSSETLQKAQTFKRLCRFVNRLPEIGVYIFTFLYAAFIPIPNDVLMAVLGVLRYRFLASAIAIALGNVVLMLLVAEGVQQIN